MHPQSSSPRRNAYLTALSQQIERELQKALDSPKARSELLQDLFRDIALKIDDRAQDILFEQKQDQIMRENSGVKNSPCFYEVLANHFIEMPDNGKSVLHLIVQLWSQSFASQIFSLLFYKWLFELPPENTEGLLRYASAFVQGASNVFWIDVQSNSKLFYPLFHYTFEEISLVPVRLNTIPVQARKDIFVLLSRFFFFYEPADRLNTFLSGFPSDPNAFVTNSPIDFFVIELTDQLQKLKVEPVLLQYLGSMTVLQGVELKLTTSVRLRLFLYSLTIPGSPWYPTRAVRHATRETLNCLYPAGRYLRQLIGMFFRMLYPSDWTSSCWNFIQSCILGLFFSLWRMLLKMYDRAIGSWRNPKKN